MIQCDRMTDTRETDIVLINKEIKIKGIAIPDDKWGQQEGTRKDRDDIHKIVEYV